MPMRVYHMSRVAPLEHESAGSQAGGGSDVHVVHEVAAPLGAKLLLLGASQSFPEQRVASPRQRGSNAARLTPKFALRDSGDGELRHDTEVRRVTQPVPLGLAATQPIPLVASCGGKRQAAQAQPAWPPPLDTIGTYR